MSKPYRSFTIRVDIGGPPTEAHKRVAAHRDGGLLPDWTAHGYIKDGQFDHGGIISTRELIDAFLEATATGLRKDWPNPEDGHRFWAAFWRTLREHGHAESLRVIEPPEPDPEHQIKIVKVPLPKAASGPAVGYQLQYLDGQPLGVGLFASREYAERFAVKHDWIVTRVRQGSP